jgi:hypothetical protein
MGIHRTKIDLSQLRKFYEGEVDILDDDQLYSALYERLVDQMPYGTAKARTGDPTQWIFDWVHKSKSFEALRQDLGV